jgi:exodeoxyribonuclease VII large subunit
VSQLTQKVRFLLESELATLWLTGEISNLVCASSGHWYLSLKDSKAQVRCAMFKGTNRYTRVKPVNGMQVLVKAKVSLYEPRGDFQLIIEQMESAGEGLLKQKYEQLKAELNAEGLFDHRYKQPLPENLQTVGIVTSATGAALKDILTVLNRRSPYLKVIIYPCLVQGERAADEIATAIDLANERDEVDVLIVGRGGGSLEDLWAFNEEAVVRAIFASEIPLISAVGHEIDHCLSDYTADLRAPTPSAAAELVSSEQGQLTANFSQFQRQLQSMIANQLNRHQITLSTWLQRLALCDPQHKLQTSQQQNDRLQAQLCQIISTNSQHKEQILLQLQQRLSRQQPQNNLARAKARLDALEQRFFIQIKHYQQDKQQQLSKLAHSLQIVSPLATIARGYSISKKADMTIVRSIADVATGETLFSQVGDGVMISEIKALKPINNG